MIDSATYTKIVEDARHNLMFRHVCPVGNITRMETLTPHGWAQLIALERRGLATWNPTTVDVLYRCADCGSCRVNSVYDQALPAAIAAARTAIVEDGLAPRVVLDLAARLEEWENPYEPQAPGAVEETGEDALFVGDEAQYLRPSALDAALTLLKAVDVEPVLVGKGRNTGYLASSLGLPDLARTLAEASLEELRATGARRLFVLSPGDFIAFAQVYNERLGVALPEGVEVVEVVPFLARRLAEGALGFEQANGDVAYAYVDPTHAVCVSTRHEAPRQLLHAVLQTPVRELFWRKGRAYPCGNLSVAFTHPELADALTRARLDDAAQSGAQGVITEDPGSLTHLERQAPEHELRVQGLYELLADHLAR